jgi:hypothetical protein
MVASMIPTLNAGKQFGFLVFVKISGRINSLSKADNLLEENV